jgi:hypothetical protein
MSSEAAARFRAAIEARAPDVTFYSPVVFKPYHGIDFVAGLLGVVADTLEDFRYVGSLDGSVEDLDADVLVFRARVGDKAVHGIDMIQPGPDGLIRHFTVMIRPLSALQAVAEAMLRGLTAAGLAPPS